MPASNRPQVNRQAHMETETRRVVVRRRSHAARIYPTPAQAAVLHRQGHTARALWNLLHNWYTCRSGGIAKRPSIAEIDRQLRGARTDPLPGWEWLAELPCQATQQVLKHYLRAWDQFYKGLARPPRPRKRSARLAVDVPQASKLCIARLSRRWGEVTILLVGRVRFRWTRPLPGVSRGCPGRITGARLIKDPLGWCISFRIEEAALAVPANPYPPVGVDRGIAHAMALSDGQYLDMPPLFRERELRRLRKLELQAARRRATRKPGAAISNRERSTYEQIAALRARQARRREDWLHNKTTELATNHSLVVIEDLAIKNMTRSARGTVDRPGRRVRIKAGLNRSVLCMAWGKAGRMLAYKCPLHGGELVKVSASYSSQTCTHCGHVSRQNRRRASFRCVACGHTASADTNAAQVLLQRGLAAQRGTAPGYGVAGRGALAAGRAVKRQPPREQSADRFCRVETPVAQPGVGCQEPMERNREDAGHAAGAPLQP
jgi:putative transposase